MQYSTKGCSRPVLMIPLRRCGSHAIRLRFNLNPDFYSPYPLHLVDFMPLVPLYGDLNNDDNYFQLTIDLVGLQSMSLVKWPNVVLDPVALFDTIKDKPRSVHSVAWGMLLQAGEKNGAKVVMDKSLDNVHYGEELTKLFNDMLFLNVVRDPRAQVNSMNRAIIHDFDTLLNTMTWVKAYDAARSLAETYPSKVLTIRFEDFLANQEAVLRKICKFFGIDFLPTMLDVATSEEAQNISKLSNLWISNASSPIPANIDKFKKTLGMEEIRIIESLAGAHMAYFGYERMTTGTIKITQSMITAAKKRSEKSKKKAWEDLRKNNYKDYLLRNFRIDYLRMLEQRLLHPQSSKRRQTR